MTLQSCSGPQFNINSIKNGTGAIVKSIISHLKEHMSDFTIMVGEKGGELNSKIHSSVKKVVSVLEARAIFRNMIQNLEHVGMRHRHRNKVETRPSMFCCLDSILLLLGFSTCKH